MDANEISTLAHLARINIDDSLVDDVADSITRILALVDQLQAVDIAKVKPMSHPLDTTQRLRADIVTESSQREALQSVAPAVEKGLFLVPRVID